MPDKIRLNKEKIDQKLAELTFSSDEQVWSDFMEFHQNTKKKSSGFNLRFDPRYLLFPLSITVISFIVYLSVNNIRNQNLTQQPFIGEKDEEVENKLIEEVNKPIQKQRFTETKKAPLIDTLDKNLKENDTLISLSESADSLSLKTESDSSIKLVVDEKTIKQDTSVQKKKKSKRKKHKNPAVSNDVFTHHPEDDQIVVPD